MTSLPRPRTPRLAVAAMAAALMLAIPLLPAAAQDEEPEQFAEPPMAREHKAEAKALRAAAAAEHKACKESDDQRCMVAVHFVACALARREAHAHSGSLRALEHRITLLEVREYRVERALTSDNLTDDERTNLTAKLERIEGAQEKLVHRYVSASDNMKDFKLKWIERCHRDHPLLDPAPERPEVPDMADLPPPTEQPATNATS